jgi:hypothetical protein
MDFNSVQCRPQPTPTASLLFLRLSSQSYSAGLGGCFMGSWNQSSFGQSPHLTAFWPCNFVQSQ